MAEYKTAAVLPKEVVKEGGSTYQWNCPLPADSLVKAAVTGRVNLDTIKVIYPDSLEPHYVHRPADYTTNLEIRVKGTRLYVYRTVSLMWTEHRLAIYDLTKRKLLTDLLVAPEDMPAQGTDSK